MRAGILIIVSILFNFILTLGFGYLASRGNFGNDADKIIFGFVCMQIAISVYEMKFIHKSFISTNYLKNFLTLNSLNFFTPYLTILWAISYHRIPVDWENLILGEQVLKWIFINGIFAGIITFFFSGKAHHQPLSSLQEDEVIDNDFIA